ncbi:hypothetical protein A3I56_03210 [Candidatus Roizmanbacteria bacterium RIFCSPLOWO2_02_FULL_43_10]|uniref:Uncharacterized protein n=3 Tax=Candidatus Roizmaniibacteriota TaxID=1752723 RepID=A0A1F7JW60_9BACT|nr:MAG: hypothetical protein A3D08_00245 [Candidatus Roizmanbacteria bacterium RIFCSPHIGHO2_02_FULL_43_11]OGK37945.1 MAG: hypothetical protein A3F32_02170 [Candidatus Roizmanbacteria bacterium RIFCSPHIGHO2_12_FULL_42_10]OGK59853.1 MAG: hypothetical protein A3I56_03210 [Candidatus Roizmanbacteria bacterium RIFCSPLOWO2_02_FULL_43_10]
MASRYVWYSKDVPDSSPDLVHNTLALGTLDDIAALKNKLGLRKVQKIFVESPMKVYKPATLHFVKKFILQLSESIYEPSYLKTTPRNSR